MLLALLPLVLAPQDAASLADKVRPLAEELLAAEIFPGFVIGVLTPDQRWIAGYGETAPGSGAAPGERTLYEIGSITKVFTGILLADAVVRGEVALEDPLAEHLPEGWSAPGYENEPVRLWQLATHTSALPRMPAKMPLADALDPFADYGADALRASLADTTLRRAPGVQYAYSNYAFGALGFALAGDGDAWEARLTERLLAPLGLTDTKRTLTDSDAARLAAPHAAGGLALGGWAFDALAGCGALRSSVADLLTFAAAELGAAPEELAEALSLAGTEHWRAPEGSLAMGLGWHLNTVAHTRWHNGQTGGYHSYIALAPAPGVAVVALGNAGHGVLDTLGGRVMLLATGCASVPPLGLREHVAVPRETLERYVGRYDLGLLAKLDVTLQPTGLFARLTAQPTHRLYPTSETEFFYRVVDAEVRFLQDEAGAVIGLELVQNGVTRKGQRVE